MSVALLGTEEAGAQERETVLDRVVHLEEGVLSSIPDVPRLETALDLKVRRVRVGDADLYVEEEGSGVPLVLINGGPGGTHHYFHPWFGAARDYARVIYYDQRGTGLSSYEPGEGGYTVEQAVADLDALRSALGIEQWVLVGYSYGGFLAQYYTTHHPERVAGLVLVSASPGMWTSLGASRQYDYITEAEVEKMREARDQLRALRTDRGWTADEYLKLLLYNNWVNGDWKRQHFYKPTPEQLAYVSLYEWVHDRNFNPIMNRSAEAVDLTGAFRDNPIPTILLEGKWDLTWGDEKPTILSRNHPRARMVVVEDAGHSIYAENPDAFFGQLERFVRSVEPVSRVDLDAYRRHLDDWRAAWRGSARYRVLAAGWGQTGSRDIVEAFTPQWLGQLPGADERLRVGLALYDVERYADALDVFAKMEDAAKSEGSAHSQAVALVWQGHVLDLLGRRAEAIARYRAVVAMGVSSGTRHDQYGLFYEFTPYATQRIETPFERIENLLP